MEGKSYLCTVLLFWELCGLRPNFHIHVSVSDELLVTLYTWSKRRSRKRLTSDQGGRGLDNSQEQPGVNR
jgi:hypothetical protein